MQKNSNIMEYVLVLLNRNLRTVRKWSPFCLDRAQLVSEILANYNTEAGGPCCKIFKELHAALKRVKSMIESLGPSATVGFLILTKKYLVFLWVVTEHALTVVKNAKGSDILSWVCSSNFDSVAVTLSAA